MSDEIEHREGTENSRQAESEARRDFLRRAAKLGVGLPAAALLLRASSVRAQHFPSGANPGPTEEECQEILCL